MSAPSISIIIPTRGRDSLSWALMTVARQARVRGDEVILVSDGPQPLAIRAAELLAIEEGLSLSTYQTEPTGDWGNAQRALGMRMATGDLLAFLDDDDGLVPSAFSTIREVANERPSRVLLFKYVCGNGYPVWASRHLWKTNVSTQCIVVPNRPERFGRWGTGREADFDFIYDTVDNFGGVEWAPFVIAMDQDPLRYTRVWDQVRVEVGT